MNDYPNWEDWAHPFDHSRNSGDPDDQATGGDDSEPSAVGDQPYTCRDLPPAPASRQRRSRWPDVFAEARRHPGEWRRILEPLKKSTAAQIASDIRNAHTRDPRNHRLRGFIEGDQFEAVWGEQERGAGVYFVWIRYVGRTS